MHKKSPCLLDRGQEGRAIALLELCVSKLVYIKISERVTYPQVIVSF